MIKEIKNKFEKLFLVFLYLQPILDVSSGILLHFNISITTSSIVRFLFMFLCLIYLIFCIRDKKINIYIILLGIYFGLYTSTILIIKDTAALGYEIKNLLTTFYFPIVLITLAALYKNKNFDIKHLNILYMLYLLFVFIPNILNLGFVSYAYSKVGNTGWFLSANVVGSIISILLPIILIYIKKIDIKIIIIALINIYVVMYIGTKVPVLSLVLIIGVNLIYYIITLIKRKKIALLSIILIPTLLMIVCSTFIIPRTSFYKNLVIHINFLNEQTNNNIDKKLFVDHFIFSQRLTFEENTRMAFNASKPIEKVLGIGYIENYSTDQVSIKTVEIDYFDVFYRHGIVGFTLFFLPLVIMMKKIILSFKKIDYNTLNIMLSITLIFVLALFQGHIFITPANSIYVALILALVYNKKIKGTI